MPIFKEPHSIRSWPLQKRAPIKALVGQVLDESECISTLIADRFRPFQQIAQNHEAKRWTKVLDRKPRVPKI